MNLEMTTPKEAIQIVVDKATTNLPQIEKSTEAACAALSAITKIATDEDDEKANKIIVKANETIKKVELLRKEFTSPLDEIKKASMEFEKRIGVSIEAVKALRNSYAVKKAAELKKQQEKIEAEKKAEQAKINNKAEVEKKIIEGIDAALASAFKFISDTYHSITLDNFTSQENILKYKPKLKQALYVNWTSSLMTDVKVMSYEDAHKNYVSRLQPVLDEYLAKLPEKRKQLEEMTKEEAAAADKEFKEEAKKLQDAIQSQSEKELEKIESEKESEKLNAEFVAQAQLQSQDEQKNVRVTYTGEFKTAQCLVNGLAEYLAEDVDLPRVKKALQFVADWCANNDFKDNDFIKNEKIVAVNKL